MDDETHVVTAFLRSRGELLLCRRSDAVGTYRGQWGGVSGFAEGEPDAQVSREIREETGVTDDQVTLVRAGRPVTVTDAALEREWVVHPYLFDVAGGRPAIELSDEHETAEWVPATAILERESVPALWRAYERVAPTVRSIAADDEHGAATLSIRALAVLRDRAGLLVDERDDDGEQAADEWDELAGLAERLLEARPAMAVLRNRVNRAMATALDDADGEPPGARAVCKTTIDGIERAVEADRAAAATAADQLTGHVLTLSRSGTVLATLRDADISRLTIAESRPAREGVDVAEAVAADVSWPITLVTDAAIAHVLATADIDRVVVGADTIQPDGSVVNKTGTRAAAIAAAREGVPVTVVAATDKCSTRAGVNLESGSRRAVYDGTASLDVLNPTFDVTPADCVSDIVTEREVLEPTDVGDVVEELRALERWREA